MDTSEQYIRMCDCPEVQDIWAKRIKRKDWDCSDFVWDIDNQNWYCIGGETGMVAYDAPGQFVWLPRQDQIQGMLGYARPSNMIEILPITNGWASFDQKSCIRLTPCDYYSQLDSWEQFWLVFYMHEHHHKVWDGKKWDGEKWFEGK